ncbi:hypothetical protein HKW97_24250 (plasmid) [Pseudomonas luteola]|uniref:dynamin family protein n=1 Tax=Pseudomonas luteola TaxID=47886 RepID=UPI00388E689E
MTQVFLAYNPFLAETQLTIDGEDIPADATLAERLSAPLHRWVGSLFELLSAHLNAPTALSLRFRGLDTDYDDIQQAAQIAQAQQDMAIELIFEPIASPAERLAALQALCDEAQAGPLQSLRTEMFRQQVSTELEPDFEVNVIATMSSGKSTVINSLLGQDLLPSKHQACTATIAQIHDDKTIPTFEGFRVGDQGQPLDDRQPIELADLRVWNDDPRTARINLFGRIPAMARQTQARLVLIDTPGPNNSRDKRHELVTRKAIASKAMPLVLYVLNATALGITDDKHLLAMVRDEMHKGGKRSRDRFLFLLNKIDDLDPESDPLDDVMATARAYLKENGIHDPVVLPVSAKLTKLIRQASSGQAMTTKEAADLPGLRSLFLSCPELQTLVHMNVSPSVGRRARDWLAAAEAAGDEDLLASIHGGIPVAELVIEEYLNKYALPDRVYQTQKVLEGYLEKAAGEAAAFEELKHRSQEELSSIHAELSRIQGTLARGEDNRRLKDTLREQTFTMPTQAAEKIVDIRAHFEQQQHALINRMGQSKLDEATAIRLIDQAREEADELRKNAVTQLENAMESALRLEAERLRAAYQDYVSDLFGGDASHIGIPALERLSTSTLSIEKTVELIGRYGQEEVVSREWISIRTWYKPWTWGDGYTREIKAIKVDFKPLVDSFSAELSNHFYSLLKDARSTIERQSRTTCEAFVQAMEERLEVELNDLLVALQEATSDGEIRKQKIAEAQAHLSWIDSFKQRLAAVLSAVQPRTVQ